MMMYMRFSVWFLLAFVGFVSQIEAQTLRLRERGTNANNVSVQVGQTVTIEVFGELGSVQAAGLSIFISVPDNAFQVVDQVPTTGTNPGQPGVQPFVQGPLFRGRENSLTTLYPKRSRSPALLKGNSSNTP